MEVAAADVGAPHLRRRCFVLAYADARRDLEDETLRAGREIVELLPRWSPEPGVCRVADGLPGRMDRLRALGNAVVPACAEAVGRAMKAIE
jgi:DNA (cytosine-5)-methyltransferase 1